MRPHRESAKYRSASSTPSGEVRAALRQWDDNDWLAALVSHVGATRLREILQAAGYEIASGSGELIAKRDVCEGCGCYALLHTALNSQRFLCVGCWSDDLCCS